ncbi:MAG TPA: RagB/SusD family nutrient uptake outer membrane protein [Puia sp.]|nr:RagB/SusD family nutrient uptake outer membrane protein [Puia sp.]
MKKVQILLRYILAAAIPLLAIDACTKLDETAYSQYKSDNFYKTKAEVISAVLRPYTHTNAWVTSSGQVGWWRVSELAADQLAWPVKGIDGQDGGNWIRLHYHTWIADDPSIVWDPWRLMYTGVGYCNDPIDNISKRDIASMGISQDDKTGYVAELKILRAFYYLKLMDLYGNIPIATKVGDYTDPATLNLPATPRPDAFKFIEKEITDNIAGIPDLSPALVGRLSKAGAYAMLAELYLNAEKWTGTQRWDDCIAACDKLITGQAGCQTGGTMALDPDLNLTFSNVNETSKEIIFSIAYDNQKSTFRSNLNSDFYHFNQRYIYDGTFNGNNGIVLVPGVFATYKNNDLRKTQWLLSGPQFYLTDSTKPVTGFREYTGQPLVFVDNIRKNKQSSTVSDMTQGEENSGIRFNKYKPGRQADAHYFSNDWAVYRLTWIYFAKAEAIMRKNGGLATQDAVDLINTCKKRAFTTADWTTEAYTTATLTMDELLAERGREFIFEGFRRSDLIRFGKFATGAWWDHTPTNDATKELFPIPLRQIAVNPNLKQNPGY